jgi:hypothetical protein
MRDDSLVAMTLRLGCCRHVHLLFLFLGAVVVLGSSLGCDPSGNGPLTLASWRITFQQTSRFPLHDSALRAISTLDGTSANCERFEPHRDNTLDADLFQGRRSRPAEFQPVPVGMLPQGRRGRKCLIPGVLHRSCRAK